MSFAAPCVSADPSQAGRYTAGWLRGVIFYFRKYASRPTPRWMIPARAHAYGLAAAGVGALLGTYYYTYSVLSLIARASLTSLGARFAASCMRFGIFSGAARIPCSIIKEVKPYEVKGSATRAIDFITFGVSSIVGPLVSRLGGRVYGLGEAVEHSRETLLWWCCGLAVALIPTLLLRETGRVSRAHA